MRKGIVRNPGSANLGVWTYGDAHTPLFSIDLLYDPSAYLLNDLIRHPISMLRLQTHVADFIHIINGNKLPLCCPDDFG